MRWRFIAAGLLILILAWWIASSLSHKPTDSSPQVPERLTPVQEIPPSVPAPMTPHATSQMPATPSPRPPISAKPSELKPVKESSQASSVAPVTPLPPTPPEEEASVPLRALEPETPVPPAVPLYKNLIPKDITIIRCYYGENIVSPDTRIGFDLNGSGFTPSFHQMISIDLDGIDLTVENLTLVTPNQIHGDIRVGPSAVTDYVFPKVLIQGLPVFTAPEPFGVVRKGEVLSIRMIHVDNNGRSGQFRILTNLDEAQFRRLRVVPKTQDLLVENLTPKLPYRITGFLKLGEQVKTGRYGVSVYLGNHLLIEKRELVSIVNPNAGIKGLVKNIVSSPAMARPGDTLSLSIRGSSFSPEDVRSLQVYFKNPRVAGTPLVFVSPGEMTSSIKLPEGLQPGLYAMEVVNREGKRLQEDANAVEVVDENFIERIDIQPAIKKGGQSRLVIFGRSFSAAFVRELKLEIDESGLHAGEVEQVATDRLEASISADDSVAPGDYWIKLKMAGKTLPVRQPSVVRVNP